MKPNAFKRTQTRQLYVALAELKQSEQVALAKFHAEDARMLNHRIRQDLKTVAAYPSLAGSVLVDEDRKPLPDHVDLAHIKSTAEFASALKREPVHQVAGHPKLSFSYLEREPSPLRGSGLDRRHMDLLLLSSDGRPILGELKRGADNLPYYALIQLLLHLVELSNPSQRERLRQLGVPAKGSTSPMDLYLFAYGAPHVTHSDASLMATATIAEKLLSHKRSALRGQVNRIAYLKTTTDGASLHFEPVFVIE